MKPHETLLKRGRTTVEKRDEIGCFLKDRLSAFRLPSFTRQYAVFQTVKDRLLESGRKTMAEKVL